MGYFYGYLLRLTSWLKKYLTQCFLVTIIQLSGMVFYQPWIETTRLTSKSRGWNLIKCEGWIIKLLNHLIYS